MKKIVIITPVYNDWESFTKLIKEIDKAISNFKDITFKLIAVNDGSKEKAPSLSLPTSLEAIDILNMKINQGHAICLANGIKYALNEYQFDRLILMDADGEDRPEEIKNFIEFSEKSGGKSLVGDRVKRSEGLIFKTCYQFSRIKNVPITTASSTLG